MVYYQYMQNSLDSFLAFVSFTHQFQQIKRTIYATGEDRNENDAEHSFQLALVGWYLVETEKFSLDINKVIKYALVHDLVEIYAGDTYFYATVEAKSSKEQKENDALQKIQKTFPEFPDISRLIAVYQEKSDPEARFIYALDKIMPVINIYLDQGRSWQRDKVSYKMVRTKDEKIAVSKEGSKIWEKIVELLEVQLDYFGIRE